MEGALSALCWLVVAGPRSVPGSGATQSTPLHSSIIKQKQMRRLGNVFPRNICVEARGLSWCEPCGEVGLR